MTKIHSASNNIPALIYFTEDPPLTDTQSIDDFLNQI